MIGSLHSMSYLKAHSKWDIIPLFFKRQQCSNIEEQYEKHNVRVFDIHLYFKGYNLKKAVFKMGNIEFYTFSVFEVLNYLNKQDNAYVRVVLEETDLKQHDAKYNTDMEKRFHEYCEMIEFIYPNIKFFGGYRECDSYKLYHFKHDAPNDIIFHSHVENIEKEKI